MEKNVGEKEMDAGLRVACLARRMRCTVAGFLGTGRGCSTTGGSWRLVSRARRVRPAGV
jgi:hypothetical protein